MITLKDQLWLRKTEKEKKSGLKIYLNTSLKNLDIMKKRPKEGVKEIDLY